MFRKIIRFTIFKQFLLTLLDDGLGMLTRIDWAAMIRVLLETVNAGAADWCAYVRIVVLDGVGVYNRIAGLSVVQLVVGVTAMSVGDLLL